MKTIKYLTMLALAAFTAQCVLAATPVVVWDGDFGTTSKTVGNDTYTLAVNGNTVATDGSTITIADTERKGVYVNWSTATDAATILVKYSGLTTDDKTYPMGLIGFSKSGQDNIDGLAVHSSSRNVKAYWGGNYAYSMTNPEPTLTMDGSETKLALKYSNGGTHSRVSYNGGDWSNLYTRDDIKGQNSYSMIGVVVGGSRALSYNGTNLQVAKGMQIYGIAIFNSILSDDDIAGYYFPSEYVAKIGENGYGTLSSAITAAGSDETTISLVKSVSENVTIPANVTVMTTKSAALTGTIDGAGTIVYDAENTAIAPTFTAANTWTGIAWFKNFGVLVQFRGSTIYNDSGSFLANVNKAGSKIKLTGFGAWYTGAELVAEIILEDGTGDRAFGWENDSGSSSGTTIIDKMSGSGLYKDVFACTQKILIKDTSGFTGSFSLTGKKITLGGTTQQADADGQVYVAANTTVTLADGATWTAPGGVKVMGALKKVGLLGTDTKFLGSGEVVYEKVGGTATVNEFVDQITSDNNMGYTQNSWTGTVIFRNFSEAANNHIGLAKFGNASSKIKLNGLSGYFNEYSNGSWNGTLVLEDYSESKPAWKQLNGGSWNTLTIGALEGTGTLDFSGSGAIQYMKFKVGTDFCGSINLGETDRSVVFGTSKTIGNNANEKGRIFVDNTATVTIASGETWTAKNGIEVSGTVNVEAGATISGAIKLTGKSGRIYSAKALTVDCALEGYQLVTETDESTSWVYTLAIADLDHEDTTSVANTATIDALHIVANGTKILTGLGGVQISELTMTEGAKIVLDPIRTPVKLTKAPEFAKGAKVALSENYAEMTLGKVTLLAWTGDAVEIPEGLFDTTSVATETYTLACEQGRDTLGGAMVHQLVLKVGNYDAEAKPLKVMPLGDSITEGTSRYSYFARPNYRIPLMAKLEAAGFKVMSLGYQTSKLATGNMGYPIYNAAGVEAPITHQWHCGMSGQECRTMSAAGWEDSIDVALDAAGYPDIVTFKIGTNDMKDGSFNETKCRASWTNVLHKIHNARPNAKIICGTVVDPDGDKTRTHEFNTYLKNFVASHEGFEENVLFVADLNAACPRTETDGTNNFADGLHPNWIGHNKTSDCWLAKIKEVYDQFGTIEPTKTINTKHTAQENIPAEYRKGFVKIATITPSASWKLSQGTDSVVTVEKGMADQTFTRVGYYMELTRKDIEGTESYGGHTRFVWADMNAFGTKNLTAFCISNEMPRQQQVVENLHVYSNDTGIRKVEPTVTSAKGFIEFTQGGMGPNQGSSAEGAPANCYSFDWNDTLNNNTSGYGCMQIHRAFAEGESWNAGEVLMAYNRWTGDSNNEIGIGSFAQKMFNTSMDYVYTASLEKFSCAAYDTMSIEIWGVPEATTPEYVPTDKVAEYEAWVETHAEELKLATPEQAKAGFLLNCAPTAEAIEAAEKEFKLTISFDEKGEVVVETTEKYIVPPTIQRSSDLKTWGEEGNFYRAVFAL